jgi:TonB family protein
MVNGSGGGDLNPADAARRGSRTRGWLVGRALAGWWVLALGIHLAWVPNLVLFFVEPARRTSSAPVEVVMVDTVRDPGSPASGRSASGRNLPEIELPGMAPGGRTAHVAAPRLERPRRAQLRTRSWASRALDHDDEPLPFRPFRPGRERSPLARVSVASPDVADIMLVGVRSLDDSLLRRRGESLTGSPAREAGSGGAPSEGNRVPAGADDLSAAAAGEGEGPSSRAARHGARPRAARPAVAAGTPSADAPVRGPLGGMAPSRQAYPVLASSDPVREARIASGPGHDFEDGAEVRVSPGPGGSSREPRGPGRGGSGRGVSGGGTTSGVLLDDYNRAVRTRVTRHWQPFPRDLAIALQQGEVVLAVRVRHDGSVEDVSVRCSSGFEQFDALAIGAVQDAGPFPPPPPEVLFRQGRNHLVLELPMRYRNPMFE